MSLREKQRSNLYPTPVFASEATESPEATPSLRAKRSNLYPTPVFASDKIAGSDFGRTTNRQDSRFGHTSATSVPGGRAAGMQRVNCARRAGDRTSPVNRSNLLLVSPMDCFVLLRHCVPRSCGYAPRNDGGVRNQACVLGLFDTASNHSCKFCWLSLIGIFNRCANSTVTNPVISAIVN